MFEHTSRYYHLADRVYETADGRQIVYRARRFIPKTQAGPVIAEADTVAGERPDLLAARAIQQPELFWRLCDANQVMNPFELASGERRRVRVYLPTPGT